MRSKPIVMGNHSFGMAAAFAALMRRRDRAQQRNDYRAIKAANFPKNGSVRERQRRARQIVRGSLTVSNGLVSA